jgi:hypothetical protein
MPIFTNINQFRVGIFKHSMGARESEPSRTRFIVPACQAAGGIDSLKSISGLLKCLQIRAHVMKCAETMIIFHAKRELKLIFTSFEIIPRKGE